MSLGHGRSFWYRFSTRARRYFLKMIPVLYVHFPCSACRTPRAAATLSLPAMVVCSVCGFETQTAAYAQYPPHWLALRGPVSEAEWQRRAALGTLQPICQLCAAANWILDAAMQYPVRAGAEYQRLMSMLHVSIRYFMTLFPRADDWDWESSSSTTSSSHDTSSASTTYNTATPSSARPASSGATWLADATLEQATAQQVDDVDENGLIWL